MSREREFLDRILADRDNPLPRLIYADWLDEQGDPRGEFIRVQCELEQPHLSRGRARLLRIREKELLQENRADWLSPVANHPAVHARWIFRRGFVEEVALETRDFLDLRRVLGQIFPLLDKLELLGLTREVMEMVVSSPVLAKFSTLRIQTRSLQRMQPFPGNGIEWAQRQQGYRPQRYMYRQIQIDHTAGAELVRSQTLKNLEALDLGHAPLPLETFNAVVFAPWIRLRSLTIPPNSLDTERVQAIAGSSFLNELQELRLGSNRLEMALLIILTYSDRLKNLESLDLRNNRLCSERNMVSLSALKRFPKLKRLDLRGCGVGNVGVETLVKSPLWGQFESLQLAHNNIQDQGLIAIASGPPNENLASLDLQHNKIIDVGLIALAKSPVLSSISHLHLEHNQIGTSGVVRLAGTKYGEGLRGLHLRGNWGIGDPAGVALANANLPNLETLDLAGTQVGDQTSLALAGSETVFRLRTLVLTKTQVRETGAMALANSESLKNLELLDLRMNHLKGNCVSALKERFRNRVLV